MAKIKVIELDACERAALEQGYQSGISHTFRRRCQMIWLKSQGRTSSQVGEIMGSCEMSVNNWVHRYFYLFYLPPYSPHLNIAEVLWRHLKYQWLRPQNYLETQTLFYQVRQALAAVGTRLKIQFAHFRLGLN